MISRVDSSMTARKIIKRKPYVAAGKIATSTSEFFLNMNL